jgi:hypothetical protein
VTVYARHLASANPVYEPPTRRILVRCLEEERRHAAAGATVLDRLDAYAGARERVADWRYRLFDALDKAGGVTGDVTAPLVDGSLLGVPPESVAPDLVQTSPDFDPAALSADLAAAVDAHRKALESADGPGVTRWIAPDAVTAAAAALVPLAGITSTRVVGLAAIGRQQMVKLRVDSARASGLVQLRWAPTPSGWRIVAAELVSTEPVSAAP